jgi:hypothetical protein
MADQGQELARDALERVCSGSDASAAQGVYSLSFRDHVNGRDYKGHEGIRQSLALYQRSPRRTASSESPFRCRGGFEYKEAEGGDSAGIPLSWIARCKGV